MTCPYCTAEMTRLVSMCAIDGVTFYLCERSHLYVDSQATRRCGSTLAKVEVRQP